MKVLVTGGSGFIGRNLCEFLKGVGADVFDYSRRNGCDMLDLEKLITKTRGVDLVYHLAAYANPHESVKMPERTAINVTGTIGIIEACRRNGFPLVYISTCEVYGDSATPLTEDRPTRSPNQYAASKAQSEFLCRSYCESDGLDIKILRLFNAYGPHQQLNKIIPRFYLLAKQNLPLPVYGDGSDYRDYTYVGDIAEAMWAARSLPAGETVNVCTGIPTTNLELAKAIIDVADSKSEITLTEYPAIFGGLRKQFGSPEKAKRLLGWQTRYPLAAGLRETAKWLETVRTFPIGLY